MARLTSKTTHLRKPKEIAIRKWVLSDYDGCGLFEIQALDEHPERDTFDDDDAINICRAEAFEGDAGAIEAIQRHNQSAEAIRVIRLREYAWHGPALFIGGLAP